MCGHVDFYTKYVYKHQWTCCCSFFLIEPVGNQILHLCCAIGSARGTKQGISIEKGRDALGFARKWERFALKHIFLETRTL